MTKVRYRAARAAKKIKGTFWVYLVVESLIPFHQNKDVLGCQVLSDIVFKLC